MPGLPAAKSAANGKPKEQATAIQLLADFASSKAPEAPERVRHEALLCLLDTVSCMIAGTVVKEVQTMQGVESTLAGGSGGVCSVFGTTTKLPPLAAARSNAFSGDALELNDLLGGHASIGNVAAALAVAEKLDSKGSDLIDSLVAGLEVTSRLFNSYYPFQKDYVDSLLVPVGLPSSVGAAAVTARLLKLDQKQTREALAIGASLCEVCPAEVIFRDGGSTKPFLFGPLPAHTGIQAGFLAQANMTGPPKILDGDYGFFSTCTKGTTDQALFTSDNWLLDTDVTRKCHACCGHIHSGADILVALREQEAARWPPVAIKVGMPPHIIPTIANKPLPTTGNEARFNMAYCLAVAALNDDVEFILPKHSLDFGTYLAQPGVKELFRNITFEDAFPGVIGYKHAEVTVTFEDGSTAYLMSDAPLGSPKNPLDLKGVSKKFDALCIPVCGEEKANAIKQAILRLDELDNVKPLFDLLGQQWK